MENVKQLYRIKQTTVKMLRKRGFDTSADDFILKRETRLNDFRTIYNKVAEREDVSFRMALTTIYKKDDDVVCVYFADDTAGGSQSTWGKEGFKEFLEYLDNNGNIRNGIIITRKPLSSNVKKSKKKLPGYRIQTFEDVELIFDISEHDLQPKFKVLSDKEINDLSSTNNDFCIDHLPSILPNDPMAKYLDVSIGQVLEIIRESRLSGLIIKSIFYRRVNRKPKGLDMLDEHNSEGGEEDDGDVKGDDDLSNI